MKSSKPAAEIAIPRASVGFGRCRGRSWATPLLAVTLALASAGCRGGAAGGSADRGSADPGTIVGDSSRDVATDSAPATDPTPAGIWGTPALAASQIPAVYVEEWRKADNRESCVLIAPASLGAGAEGEPRAATFAGGWAVAYDLPDQRSAFGVAGSGSTTSGDIYSEWSNRREWPDGSFVEYGPEGGQGPNQLAYLRVAGQDCLYNIWSRLGLPHLELLLDQLRRVTVPGE